MFTGLVNPTVCVSGRGRVTADTARPVIFLDPGSLDPHPTCGSTSNGPKVVMLDVVYHLTIYKPVVVGPALG